MIASFQVKRLRSAASTPRPVWLLFALIAILAINWFVAIGRWQVNIPVWDQWDFFRPLFEEKGLWSIFNYQHGPHRQGLGFLLSAGVMTLSSWDTRWESIWIASLTIASAGLALNLKRRLLGPLRVKDAWIPLIVMSLGQYESVISTPNASHSVFPLMLILLTANLWLNRSPARFAMVGAFTGALIFTGFGMFGGVIFSLMLATVWSYALKERRWADAWAVGIGLSLAAAAWLAFFHDYIPQAAAPGFRFPWTPLSDYLEFTVLMLANAAQHSAPAPFRYALGGLILISAIALLAASTKQWFSAREKPAAAAVNIALLSSSLLYCAATAIGRVQLGTGAGIASRYTTLLIPIWLAFGFWGECQSRLIRRSALLILFTIALAPCLDLRSRNLGSWLGTVGLTTGQVHELERNSELKQQTVELYLSSNDVEFAQKMTGQTLHPSPAETQLSRKLAWLRSHRLSLFAGQTSTDYGPWLRPAGASWENAELDEGPYRWMRDEVILVTRSRRPAWVNFRLMGHVNGLDGESSGLAFSFAEHAGLITADDGDVISLPVEEGVQRITFRSAAGTRATDNPRDHRRLSFQLSHPTLTPQPAGPRWHIDSKSGEWRRAFRLQILSGAHDVESNRLRWTDASVRLRVETTTTAFLNVAIVDRNASLPDAPVVFKWRGRSLKIPLAHRSRSFSLPIQTGGAKEIVELRYDGGARSPAEDSGQSTDHRKLALRLSRLTLDEEPAYPVLSDTES